MTVHQLRQEMPEDEFVRWTRYFRVKQQNQQLEYLKATSGR